MVPLRVVFSRVVFLRVVFEAMHAAECIGTAAMRNTELNS